MVPRILMVGEETTRHDGGGRVLENQGYQVDLVHNSRAALQRVAQVAYDLLLVNLSALGGNGLELIERLQHSHPGIPQIVVVGADERRVAIEAMRVGACDVIWEPMEDPSVLTSSVSRGLEWARLNRESARYQTLIHCFPGIIFWSNLEFEIELIHGQVQEITGYPSEAFAEQGLRWDEIVYATDRDDVFPQALQCLRRGEPAELEYRLQHPDGTLRWVECSLVPILDSEGQVQSLFGVALNLDITGHKQIEVELNQRLQEQELLYTIGQLVSSNLQIDQVMQLVVEYMSHLVSAAGCVISDWNPETGVLAVRARYVRPDQLDPASPVGDMGQGPLAQFPSAARALRDGEPFVVYASDPQVDPQERHLLNLCRRRGVAGIPLVVHDRIIGLAQVYLAEGDQPFDFHDLRLLQMLANQIAVAIDNARLFSVTQANEAAMRNLSLRLINVQEQERRRIAQELHDELGQLLTATKINIDLVRRKLSQQSEGEGLGEVTSLHSRLEDASALTDKVLTNVRAMTVELRPTLLDDMGVVPTLRWYLRRYAERTGIQVKMDFGELPARLLSEIETTIYRVVVEALTNIARHAQASQVHIQLTCADGVVTTLVEDDGQGFDVMAVSERPAERQSLGLTGIRERAMLLEGRAEITSQPGQGTRVEVALPALFRQERE